MSNTLGFIEGWYPRIVDPIEKKRSHPFRILVQVTGIGVGQVGLQNVISVSIRKSDWTVHGTYFSAWVPSSTHLGNQQLWGEHHVVGEWRREVGLWFICEHTLPVPVAGTCQSGNLKALRHSKQLEGRRLCLSSPWTTSSFPPYIFSSESRMWASQ